MKFYQLVSKPQPSFLGAVGGKALSLAGTIRGIDIKNIEGFLTGKKLGRACGRGIRA